MLEGNSGAVSTTWTKLLYVKVLKIVRILSNLWIHEYFVNGYEQLWFIHPWENKRLNDIIVIRSQALFIHAV